MSSSPDEDGVGSLAEFLEVVAFTTRDIDPEKGFLSIGVPLVGAFALSGQDRSSGTTTRVTMKNPAAVGLALECLVEVGIPT
jgi:hypothetical protein